MLKHRTDITPILLSIRLPLSFSGKWTGLERPQREPFPKDRGFTLLDLIIVIIILGVLAMMIVPQFNSMISEAKINGAIWELVSGLEYAGSLAIEYQRPFGVKVDTSGNWFRVFDNRHKSDAATHYGDDPPTDAYGVILNPFDKTWYTTDFDTMDMHEGVNITSAPAGGELIFYPDGHSASSDSTFVISYHNEQKTITVDGITGKVSVQEPN